MYLAQALAEQGKSRELKEKFAPIAQQLSDNEDKIVEELNSAQGGAANLGGDYRPDSEKVSNIMRPSATLNGVIDKI